MTLAKELLALSEKETVITYLDRCKVFWRMDKGKIEIWKRYIKLGMMPDFGANLKY